MQILSRLIIRLFIVGGWAPLTVFLVHVFISRVLDIYDPWPHTDIPMHFLGGLSIAFFVSRCFRALPRDAAHHSRVDVLELVLVGSLTATAAVLWEFAEFIWDRVFGTNIQLSLANAMQDMALGILGAVAFIALAHRRRARLTQWRDVARDWLAGAA